MVTYCERPQHIRMAAAANVAATADARREGQNNGKSLSKTVTDTITGRSCSCMTRRFDAGSDHDLSYCPCPQQVCLGTDICPSSGEHEHTIVGYSLVKGIGDGEPIASERFSVGGHEWVCLHSLSSSKRAACVPAVLPGSTLLACKSANQVHLTSLSQLIRTHFG